VALSLRSSGTRPPWGRLAFTLALCLEAVPKAIDMPELLHHAEGSAALGLGLALALVALALRWCWREDDRAGWAVVALFAVAWLIERASAEGHQGVRHGSLLPVSALIATLATPRLTGGRSAALAQEAAWGAVAAVYTLAGLSKVLGSGLAWFSPTNLGLLILERAADAPEPLMGLRLAVAGSPALCVVLATGALLAELGGVALLWPRARPFLALALVFTHVGIAALMGYVYASWAIVLIALTWGRLARDPTPEAPPG
jgi:hypothetical protein